MKKLYVFLLLSLSLGMYGMEKEMTPAQQKYTAILTWLLSPYAAQNVIQDKVEECLMRRIQHNKFSRDLHAHLSIPGLAHDKVTTAIFDTHMYFFTPKELKEVFKNRPNN